MPHDIPASDTGQHAPASTDRVTWPDFWITAGIAIALYVIAIALYRQMPDTPLAVEGLVLLAISGIVPLVSVLVMIAIRKRNLSLFGIRQVSPKWLAVAFAVGIGVVVLNLGINTLIAAITDVSNVQAGYQSAATSGIVGFLGTILLGAVLTPIGEELLFRGVLFTLLTRYGVWLAAILSSVVFALSHGINFATPVALTVGLAAAWLMHKTKSIWPGVVVHFVNNACTSTITAIYFHSLA